jgi:hypothetical protein
MVVRPVDDRHALRRLCVVCNGNRHRMHDDREAEMKRERSAERPREYPTSVALLHIHRMHDKQAP